MARGTLNFKSEAQQKGLTSVSAPDKQTDAKVNLEMECSA